jgi:hypothetical protein
MRLTKRFELSAESLRIISYAFKSNNDELKTQIFMTIILWIPFHKFIKQT